MADLEKDSANLLTENAAWRKRAEQAEAECNQARNDLEALRQAAQAVDATWDWGDGPMPPYMDCVDTDRLLALRRVLSSLSARAAASPPPPEEEALP